MTDDAHGWPHLDHQPKLDNPTLVVAHNEMTHMDKPDAPATWATVHLRLSWAKMWAAAEESSKMRLKKRTYVRIVEEFWGVAYVATDKDLLTLLAERKPGLVGSKFSV